MATQGMARDEFSATTPGPGFGRSAPTRPDAAFSAALIDVAQSAADLLKAQIARSGRRAATGTVLGLTTLLLALIGLGFLVFAVHDAFVYAFTAGGVDALAVAPSANLATSILVVGAAVLTGRSLRSVLGRQSGLRES